MRQNELNIWINALKGGEYNQVKNALKTDNGYCCLGVLCRISLPEEFESSNMLGYGNLTSFLGDNIEGKKELLRAKRAKK
jgi:hypothetical protein